MEPPSFSTTGPQILRAAPGSDASLIVPLPSGSPPFEFEWSRAGAKLDDRFTRSDDAGGVRLTITAAQTGDSGVYTLQASNAAGKDTTRVRLEVSPDEMPTGEDPPTFLRRLQDLTVKVGTRTRFLVEIVSSTECRVTWYRNERRLLEAERIALVRDGNFWCADISAVSVDDAGRWTCTAENVGGRASCSAHLNVLVPKAYKRPEFVEELRALLTEQGTVSLECKVVGVPTPVLRWFKDSREIKAGDVFALTANAEDPTSLGTYTCEAVNCMGRAYSSSKVHVVGRASREGSSRPSSGGITPEPPPIFTKELEDHFVRICEPLTLSCNIVVPPWPRNVVWYNKEGKIDPSERYRVLEDGVGGYLLEVPTAEWPDEGEWKCVVTSTGGRVGISTCYVSMDVPKNYRKPRFMENLQAVLTEEGLVSFECKVVGFPTPVLSWFKDGQELKPGDVYQLTGTNSLGSYCCIARNCMGQASSSAELTVEDIQNQLNEEEKLQLFSKNQAPKFLQGLKSVETKIDEPFRFTIKVAIPPEPTVSWYRDDQPVDESLRCHLGKEERGVFVLDIQNLEFMDQAEWKCVAMNDFGHSVTSCFLKLIIPRHYKKPRFLENLQAILSDEGAVNLECKVIGVPQPVLKWYKDGEELKPGDIHRIISGQDGTCCLGTYTCEAQNCMGIAASSASLLGFEDSMKARSKKKADEQALQRNLSLSTIHEERTSQMYDTPVGDITLDEKGEISFSFDGKEVSVSLYETPDLTEEEALQIVEMYADQLSENVTEHNVVELPPLRFVKETSTSGNLLMEAIIIDVSPEYFTSPEEDLRTEADIEDMSIADENGPPQLSLDQDADAEDYLEKTIALMSDEIADFPKKNIRKKSDSQRSVDDYFSLSRDQSLSEEKKDDDTQILSESDLQSFASAHSSGKPKSKSSKPSIEDGQESSDVTKTVVLKEDLQNKVIETEPSIATPIKPRRRSRSSRRSSSGSEKSLNIVKDKEIKTESESVLKNLDVNKKNIKTVMNNTSLSLTEVMNEIQILERDIILKSEFMSTAATASNSLEIINSLITPLSEVHSVTDAIREMVNESSENITPLLNTLPHSLKNLQDSLTIISKCIDVESDNKTLVKKTCMSIIRNCGYQLDNIIKNLKETICNECLFVEKMQISNIETIATDLINIIHHNIDILKSEENKKAEKGNVQEATIESKHLHATQKAIHELRGSLRSLLFIIDEVDCKETNFANIRKSEIILNDMSTPIQDLQTALEQIEILSVTESNTDLQKYNTEIIEKAMESVLKLRTSFEQLSGKESNIEDKDGLSEVLNEIKINIREISIQLDELDTKTGKFDILSSDNKLETLQKIAQILINLENNLPILESATSIKGYMTEFHKNLTKVLENVIESNDANKYFTLLEICDAVNRMNTSIKNIESNNVLSLASIGNTLNIIHTNVSNNVFEPELNLSMQENISNLLICIQENMNKAEELNVKENLEEVKDLSLEIYEEGKVKVVLENIEHTIIAISNVVSHESSTTIDFTLKKALENICPILVDLKYCIASSNVKATEKDEKLSDLESLSLSQSIANPLLDLHQNISVLNQVICENADSQEFSLLMEDYAKPLLDLRNTLEILQHDVMSQCIDNVPYPELNTSIANVVENLKSCIVMIQEQHAIEAADDMSTLEDISGIKTTADVLSSEDFATVTVNEMENVQFVEESLPSARTDQALQILKENIMTLQDSEILNFIDSVKIPENSSIKSLNIGLEEISAQIESILQPITIEPCEGLTRFFQLVEIIKPLQEIRQHLSVIDIDNIPVYTDITGSTPEKKRFIKESIQNIKSNLNYCLDILQPAIEVTDNAVDVPTKINTLRQTCKIVNGSLNMLDETRAFNTAIIALNDQLKEKINRFEESISSFDNIQQVKTAIEDLYEAVVSIKETLKNRDIINRELYSMEDLILLFINDIENNINSLEQCHFVNLAQIHSIKNNVIEMKEPEHFEDPNDKEDDLNKHLSDLIPPLNLICHKLLKQIVEKKETEEVGVIDATSFEMHLSDISENINKLEQCLNLENISNINREDISLGMKVNEKINYILNYLKTTRMSESLTNFLHPIETIAKMLQRILPAENEEDKHRSLKEKAETLLQQMEHYIEITEIVEEVSAVIKIEDLKETANIVRELQQSIVTLDPASEVLIESSSNNKIKEEQAEIAQKLHKALITLQTQAVESTQELATTANEDIRQRIIEVVSDLQNDFIALTGTNVIVEESSTTSLPEIIQKETENITLDEQNTQNILEIENQTLKIAPQLMDEPENTKIILPDTVQPIEDSRFNDQAEQHDNNILSQTNIQQEQNIINKRIISQEFDKPEYEENLTSIDKSLINESELKEPYSKSEKLGTIKDILIENVKEYISDRTMIVLTKLSNPLHCEHLKKTIEIATQLLNDTKSEYSSPEQTELSSFSTEQIELVLSLNEAILIMYETTFEESQELENKVGKDELDAFKDVVNNLRNTLQDIITNMNTLTYFTQVSETQQEETSIKDPVKNIQSIPSVSQPISGSNQIEKNNDLKYNATDTNVSMEVVGSFENNPNNLKIEDISDVKVTISATDLITATKGDLTICKTTTDTKYVKEFDIEKKEKRPVNKETLKKYLSDYISEDMVNVIDKMSAVLKLEDVNNSIQIAHHLYNILSSDESVNLNFNREQLKIALLLDKAVSSLCELPIQETEESDIANHELKKANYVMKELLHNLHVVVESTLTQSDLEVLDLDEFKVSITKEPFKFRLIIDDRLSDTKSSKETSEDAKESIPCTKEVETTLGTEIETTKDAKESVPCTKEIETTLSTQIEMAEDAKESFPRTKKVEPTLPTQIETTEDTKESIPCTKEVKTSLPTQVEMTEDTKESTPCTKEVETTLPSQIETTEDTKESIPCTKEVETSLPTQIDTTENAKESIPCTKEVETTRPTQIETIEDAKESCQRTEEVEPTLPTQIEMTEDAKESIPCPKEVVTTLPTQKETIEDLVSCIPCTKEVETTLPTQIETTEDAIESIPCTKVVETTLPTQIETTEDAKESIPCTKEVETTLRTQIETTEDAKESISCTKEVETTLHTQIETTEDTKESLQCTDEVGTTLPTQLETTEDANKSIPCSKEVETTLPTKIETTEDAKESFPCTKEVETTIPTQIETTEDTKESLPCTNEVGTTLPTQLETTEDAKEGIPCTKEVKTNLPTQKETSEDLISCDELSIDIQSLKAEINIERVEDTSLMSEKNVEVILPNVKKDLQSRDGDIDSIIKLEEVLKEVSDMIDLSCDDNLEPIQNSLDEVQTIIMELKSDFGGTIGDTINETLEDLECNVRSVQLQINEHSPPVLLKEACSNLQVLVAHLGEINDVEKVLRPQTNQITNDLLDVCSNDVEKTIDLIQTVSSSENAEKLENIISNLNKIKDTIKFLRSNFLTNAETLIMGGIQINQSLDQIEENIFCLEKDLESEKNIDVITRDSILSAIHSIYGSISNMRGTVSSVQKKYLYENYGEPSRYFLLSIKNVTVLLKSNENRKWNEFAKTLRKVLNHFEDVKFYINFDKTARLPSDAAFTKIILGELHSVLSGVVLQNATDLDVELSKHTGHAINYINEILKNIEQMTTLEVKEKIPIFKELSKQMFELTENIKLFVENKNKSDHNNLTDDTNVTPKIESTTAVQEEKVAENVIETGNVQNASNIEIEGTVSDLLSKMDDNLTEGKIVTTIITEENTSSIDDNVETDKLLQEIDNSNDLKYQIEHLKPDEIQNKSLKLRTEEESLKDIEQQTSEEINKNVHLTDNTKNKTGIEINKNSVEIEQQQETGATEDDKIIDINQEIDKNERLEMEKNVDDIDINSTISENVIDVFNEQDIAMMDKSQEDVEIKDSEKVNIESIENKTPMEQIDLHEKDEYTVLNVVKEEETELTEIKDGNTTTDGASIFIQDSRAVDKVEQTEPIKNKTEEPEKSHLIIKEIEENRSIMTDEMVTENINKSNRDSIFEIDIIDNKNIMNEKDMLVDVQLSENNKSLIDQDNAVSEPLKNEQIKHDIKLENKSKEVVLGEINQFKQQSIDENKLLEEQKQKSSDSVEKDMEDAMCLENMESSQPQSVLNERKTLEGEFVEKTLEEKTNHQDETENELLKIKPEYITIPPISSQQDDVDKNEVLQKQIIDIDIEKLEKDQEFNDRRNDRESLSYTEDVINNENIVRLSSKDEDKTEHEANDAFIDKNKEYLITEDVENVDQIIKVLVDQEYEKLQIKTTEEKQENKNEGKEIERDVKTKNKKLKLIEEKTKDGQELKEEQIAIDKDLSDKNEERIKEIVEKIKIETITSVEEIAQVTSPLNICLEIKENVDIKLVESLNEAITNLVSVNENYVQITPNKEEEINMEATHETDSNLGCISDEICDKNLKKVDVVGNVSGKTSEIKADNDIFINNKVKEDNDKIHLEIASESDIKDEDSNKNVSVCENLQLENSQESKENNYEIKEIVTEVKAKEENINLKSQNDINETQQPVQHDQNTLKNKEETILSASKDEDGHELDKASQLQKNVTKAQEVLLNVEENRKEICQSSVLDTPMGEHIQTEISALKDTETQIDQNVTVYLDDMKDDNKNIDLLYETEKEEKDAKSNKSMEVNILSNKTSEKEAKLVEQQLTKHDVEDIETHDKNEKYQSIKEEYPKMNTNEAILNHSKEEKSTEQEDIAAQKHMETNEETQVETLTETKNKNGQRKKESPNKQLKEKRRSKKSRETPKQTAADNEVKSQEVENKDLELNKRKNNKKVKSDESLKLQDSQPIDGKNILIMKDEQSENQKQDNEGHTTKQATTTTNGTKTEDLKDNKTDTDNLMIKRSKKEEQILAEKKAKIENNLEVQYTSGQKDEINKEVILGINNIPALKDKQKEEKYLFEVDDHEDSRKLENNVLLECSNKKESIKECSTSTSTQVKDDRQEIEQRKVYPVIKEHSLTHYESEFSRPPGYIAKPFGIEESASQVEINTKGQTIYKAQTLLRESQLRSSLPPHMDQNLNIEKQSQIKERTKAVSECRSTLSEKRTSSGRDNKRKPVFSTFLTDRTAVEGSRVKLTCSILSPTDPTVTWYKNGKELDNKHKFRSKFIEGLITLEILNAIPSDSGEYSCSIENENGSITSSANLKVYPSFESSPIPPTFTRSIRDNYHLAENELILECRIRGQPLPTITWLKDNKPIVLSDRYQAHYLADGVCRLTISSPNTEDSGKYTCKAENSMWSDQISHDVYFTGKKGQLSPNLATVEKVHFSRHALESRRPHFTNVLSDHKVVYGGTIGLQVEIRGSPIRVEWLREGHSITELYRNAQTYVDHGIYTLALSDVTEQESGLYTCRAYSTQGNVDMNASITVVQPNQYEGKPASIVSRPEKDVLISVGEDLNISFRVHGEPKAKVFFMKGIRDITNSQRVCKMTSDDYVKFTLKRTVVSDAGTYCVFARNAYGCDRAFVTVVIRQRASSDNLISDWTYPMDDLAISSVDRNYKSVPDRIPSEPSAVDGGNNWISLAWPKPDPQSRAPVLAYKVESWLLGKEGGARWVELGITPRNSFDAFNLKQGEEYHFRVTPRNRYGWGESVQTSVPIGIGLAGDRPEFIDILPGQLKVLVGETATLSCSFKGKPIPEIMWMKNGHEIEEEVGRVNIAINDYNSSLRIEAVKSEDEGRYSCEATNIHGRSSTYSRMAVITDRQIWQADAKLKRERSAGVDGEYPPQFTMRLRDRRVQATYPVRLTCQVVGNPTPTVKWFKNEEEIVFDGRHTASQDEYFYTLEIAPTTLEDGGVYEAMARNGCGAVSCRCSLVVDKGIRAYIAPEFCCGLEPLYHLSEGDELRISAIVEAYPSVGVTWYRDGVRLRPSRRAIMTLDRDGQIELAVASVTGRDAGVYTCTASNEVGMASTSGKVEIVSGEHVVERTAAPPIVVTSDTPYSKEPMFIKKPRSSEAREGDTVIIECEVIGDPKPDVYWLRDFLKPDYYRDSSHFKRVGAGPAYRFEIPHAKFDYTGAYSIVARNIHGETKAIISLQILAKDLTCGDDVHNIRFGRVDVIPRFDKELTDLLCYDGDAIEFECSVTGNPDPDIRWFHYNDLVSDCADFESSYEIGIARLKIKQVTAEDEGTYTCEASNSLGKSSSSACLVVYPPGEPNTLSQRLRRPPALLSAASTPRSTPRTTPARSLSRTPGPDPRRFCSPSREIAPKFYTYPYNRVAEEGDTIVFQCAVKGLPPPWATWDKDGIIITPSARISIKEKDEMFRILEIEQVTIEDVGLYRISLENDYGRAEASARLEVITQKGKFYGTRSYSVSPRKTLPYRRRTPSFSKQD